MVKRTLDDRFLKSLAKKPAVAGKTYDVMDAVLPGFGVRVSDKGRRTFVLVARYPGGRSGSPARRKLGLYGVLSLEQARTKARSWIELIQKGVDPSIAEERERAAEVQRQENTFGAVAEDFIREKLPSERQGKDVERALRRDLMAKWADRPITDITDLDVLTVIKAKKQDGPVAARNLLALAKRMFRWAIAQRVYGLTASPCASIQASDIVGETRSRDRILTDDEIFALWRAAGHLPEPYGAIYKLLALNALRLREVANASWSEFEIPNELWTIPAERMKGKNEGKKQARAHVVPLTSDSLTLIEAIKKGDKGDFVFSNRRGVRPVWMGAKIKSRVDERMLRTLRALARVRGERAHDLKLKPWVNHDIRRTVRSHLSRLKIAEEAREAVLAHVRPGIKGVYDLHDYLDEKRDALEQWATRLRSIVNPPSPNVIPFRAVQ